MAANLTSSEWSAFGVGSSVVAFTGIVWSDAAGTVDSLGRSASFPGQIVEADIVFNPAYQFGTDIASATEVFNFQLVITHEIGHLLGLDHSPIVASTMFSSTLKRLSSLKPLSADDIAGLSSIYSTDQFSSKGTLTGTVRTTSNRPVYGAVVVALNSSGQPVASALTDPNGQYVIMGLDPGTYTIYAEPLDGPTTSSNVRTLSEIYPQQTVYTSFTTRFR